MASVAAAASRKKKRLVGLWKVASECRGSLLRATIRLLVDGGCNAEAAVKHTGTTSQKPIGGHCRQGRNPGGNLGSTSAMVGKIPNFAHLSISEFKLNIYVNERKLGLSNIWCKPKFKEIVFSIFALFLKKEILKFLWNNDLKFCVQVLDHSLLFFAKKIKSCLTPHKFRSSTLTLQHFLSKIKLHLDSLSVI